MLPPLLRVGGRLLNQVLASERGTRVLRPCARVPPQPLVAAGPWVQPGVLGRARGGVGTAENRTSRAWGWRLRGGDELPPWVVTPTEGLAISQQNKPKLGIQTSHLQFETGLIFL